jgi:hypothetical protein
MLVLGAALLLSQLVLSAALAAVALRPRPVLLVPGARDQRVVIPEEVPDDAVKRFGLLYLRYFDCYIPQTVEEQSNHVLRYVAVERLEAVQKALSERAAYVLRAREASHLTLPLPAACTVERIQAGLLRFTATAVRTIHIAGERKSMSRVRYVLDLRPDLPSDEDPYGLVVVAQSIREEPMEVGDGKR